MPITDDKRVQHLLGRAGFGATPAEVSAGAAVSYEDRVRSLLNAPVDNDLLQLPEDNQKSKGIAPLQSWWVHRMTHTVNPMLERMILFWHNHFTSAISKVAHPILMERQYDLFRKHALGNFGDLAKAVTRDAAMLIWLDGRGSMKKAPNENYARELMELFTIGIGNYTEQDVREAARAFTGFHLDHKFLVSFLPKQHDDGLKTILGKTANFDADGMIDLLLEKPETSRFIARKFLTNFVAPNPDSGTIQKFGSKLMDFNYEIKPFLNDLFTSDEFLAEANYRSLVKSPCDFVIGIRRRIPSAISDAESANDLRLMGQSLFDPPNVAGWPGGPVWLNASTMLARYNFAERAATLCDVEKLVKGDNLMERALQLAGIPDAGEDTRQALSGYTDLQSSASRGKSRADFLREALHLALVAPEAQLK